MDLRFRENVAPVAVEDVTAPGAAERTRGAVPGRSRRRGILVRNAGGGRPRPGLGEDTAREEAMAPNPAR